MTTAANTGISALESSFRTATDTSDQQVFTLCMAGHRIDLRFTGPGLIGHICPAFRHLEVEPEAAPELVVDIWDSATTGATSPQRPEVPPGEPMGAVYVSEASSVLSIYQPAMEAFSAVDLEGDHGWFWVEDAAALPFWERAAPLRQILHPWMARRGHQQVHAGAVGRPDGGILLVGKGGSGKSTTSLVTLGSDLRYASDDFVMVSADPAPWVHSMYSSGKVNADNLHRVPHIASTLDNPDRLDTEKAVIFVEESFPGRPIAGFPLRAVVVPRVTGGPDTRALPISRAAALAALAPSTVFLLPTAGREAFELMARLVRQVPCFVLELGTDVSQIPTAINRLLDELDGVSS